MICQMFDQFLITPPFPSLWNVWLLHSPRINRLPSSQPSAATIQQKPSNKSCFWYRRGSCFFLFFSIGSRPTKCRFLTVQHQLLLIRLPTRHHIIGGALKWLKTPPKCRFFTVDHQLLLIRLPTRHHIIGGALKRLKSYVEGRSQCENYGTRTFQSIHVANGTPKGSVLGSRCSNCIYFDCNSFDTSE